MSSRSRSASARVVAGILTALAVTALVAVAARPVDAAPSQARASIAKAAKAAKANWTLMLYEVADTQNIAEGMIANLALLAQIPAMPNVHVVALVDLPPQGSKDYPTTQIPGVKPFSTAKLLELGQGNDQGKWKELDDFGELQLGSPKTLAQFIEIAAGRFPADKYGLVFSDHGGAFRGGYWDETPSGDTHLSVPQMRAGVQTGLHAAGIGRFELIDHDSCLMSSYEVTSALAPFAKTMVGSEEITAGSETLARTAITALGDDISGAEWGRLNNQAYADYAERNNPGSAGFTAMSSIDGDQLKRLDAALGSFAKAAAADMDKVAPIVARARARSLEFIVGLEGDATTSDDVIDLGDFLRNLQGLPKNVQVARDAAYKALQAAVLDQQVSLGTRQATGLNVHLPTNPAQLKSAALTDGTEPPGWNAFLTAYLKSGQSRPDSVDKSVRFTSPDAQVLQQDAQGLRIAGQLAGGSSANVVSATTRVGTRLFDAPVVVIEFPATVDSGAAGQVQGGWNYSVTTLSGPGGKNVPISMSYQAQSDGLVGTGYGLYTAPNGAETQLRIQVLLSSQGDVGSVSYTALSENGVAAFTPAAGGRIRAALLTPGDGGDLEYQFGPKSVPYGDGFAVGFSRLPADRPYRASLVVEDQTRQESTSSVNGTVPAP